MKISKAYWAGISGEKMPDNRPSHWKNGVSVVTNFTVIENGPEIITLILHSGRYAQKVVLIAQLRPFGMRSSVWLGKHDLALETMARSRSNTWVRITGPEYL